MPANFPMHRRTVSVKTEHGLHIRPCSLVASAAQRYASEIRIWHQGLSADAKRVLELMTLAAGPDAVLELTAVGEDAEAALENLGELFNSDFSEAQTVTN